MAFRKEVTPRRLSGFFPTACVVLVSILLGFRLHAFISNHAVNLLVQDQWDLYNSLFEPRSLWQTFTQQHGPPRLGLGVLLTNLIAGWSRWDTHAESDLIFGVVCAALLAALWLKQRLFGTIGYADAILPCLFLTTIQDETFVGVPILSHSALPVLLLMLYCLAWTIETRRIRIGCVLGLNFLLIFTGFGILAGAITIALFLLDCFWSIKERRAIAASFAALGVSVFSAALFFVDYSRAIAVEGVDCYVFPHPQPWKYPVFAGLILSKFCGFRFAVTAPETRIALAVGAALLMGFLLSFAVHGWKLLRTSSPDRISLIVCILIGYCLLFNFNAAAGRVCIGLYVSQAARYMTAAIPGFLGFYFTLLALGPMRDWPIWRWAMPGSPISSQFPSEKTRANVFLIAFAASILHGHLPFDIGAGHPASDYSQRKRTWAACYRKNEDITTCDRAAGISVYPWPARTRLKEKLDFLKRNKLNLFADR